MANKIVTYMVGRSKKSVKLTEAQASEIMRRRDEHPEKLISLGYDTVMGKAIVAIQTETEGVLNKEKVKALRRSLKDAASGCFDCGFTGFRRVFTKDGQTVKAWEPRCETAMALCGCQVKIKERYEVAADDFSWSNLDSND